MKKNMIISIIMLLFASVYNIYSQGNPSNNEVNYNNKIVVKINETGKINLDISGANPKTKIKITSGGEGVRILEITQAPQQLEVTLPSTDFTIYGDVAFLEIYRWSNKVNSVDISNCKSISKFRFPNEHLVEFKMSGASNLSECDIENSNLKSLEIKDCPQLSILKCRNTHINKLTLEGTSELRELNCDSNHIQELDLSACTKLEKLDCSTNPLTKLILPDFTLIDYLNVSKTMLPVENLNEIYCKLPKANGWFFGLNDQKDTNYENVMLSSGKNIINKGWKIVYWDVRTDTNRDQGVNKRDEQTPFFPGGEEDCADIEYNTIYPITVSTERVHQKNCKNIVASGIEGNISYDPETNTLTLDNAHIKKQRIITKTIYYLYGHPEVSWTYNIGKNIYYFGKEELNIQLIGKNVIDPTALSYHFHPYELANSFIQSAYSVNIYGDGELKLSNASAYNNYAKNDLHSITVGGVLTIDKCTLSIDNSLGFGISYPRNIILKNNAFFYANTAKGAVLTDGKNCSSKDREDYFIIYDDAILRDGNDSDSIENVSAFYWKGIEIGYPKCVTKKAIHIIPKSAQFDEMTDSYSVFPNPARDFININLKYQHIGKELIMLNILGEVIYRTTLYTNELRIPLAAFAKGMYIIQIGDERKKLVIQ